MSLHVCQSMLPVCTVIVSSFSASLLHGNPPSLPSSLERLELWDVRLVDWEVAAGGLPHLKSLILEESREG